ncbi:ABC-2 family transporter [Herbinix hemicellulosilytica]|uniref:Putative membrane protein n=1 Tax=Herbinix hemicellulosilytica TaxID=1564487 RepID=A0A0H5STW8_HERHM|nr:ABC-2 transporter permease [Herbinix hemicellulosilytica]RBP60034.1 ABC-2 family transporter [Herbinix hemicellulosilytica]CRZ33758.1 putative membrane protein [Herbinix hemicellulosilytica]
MLKKLIKHELVATGRVLLPIYGITIILSFVNRLLINVNWDNTAFRIIGTIMRISYIFAITATFFVTFVLIILRFYKNLMSDEGYLMFTLPVKPYQLINSKLISSVLWMIVSVIVVIASLLILLLNAERALMLKDTWIGIITSLKSFFGGKYILLIIEIILATIISLIQQILLIYVSVAIGHLFTGHKVMGAFASYIVINTVIQTISLFVVFSLSYFSRIPIEEFENLPHAICLIIIVLGAVYSIFYYIITNYIFSKKLNLE